MGKQSNGNMVINFHEYNILLSYFPGHGGTELIICLNSGQKLPCGLMTTHGFIESYVTQVIAFILLE